MSYLRQLTKTRLRSLNAKRLTRKDFENLSFNEPDLFDQLENEERKR